MGAAAILAATLITGSACGGERAVRDSSAARQPEPATRPRRWSLAVAGALGSPAAGDLNRSLELANLALASAMAPFDAYSEVSGELSFDLSERLSIRGRAGYLWREHPSGRTSRRLRAMPATLGLAYRPLVAGRWRAGATAAAGALLGVSYTGADPLGGVRRSGSGMVVEGGVEVEYFLARSFSLSARGLGRKAMARHVLSGGGDVDVSGVLGQGIVRVYFRR